MQPKRKNHARKLISTPHVELYFLRIRERQRLEDEFYRTGNAALLPEIEKARERIREAMSRLEI